jgi:phosphoribosyl-ATP pyrophosphohydrolase/phosphoribosyl-AMP cyclohydrolase
MIIASIDIQDGKVVQLKQGEELLLQRDNALELAKDFDRYGEIAVIDLNAAKGNGSNLEMIKPLLRTGQCRVGGGIRTAQQAKELISLGAQKVIIGSSVFRTGGKFAVNIPLLEEISNKIGRQKLIVAVDARNSEIVVDGWKTSTGLNLEEAAKLVEPFAGELLFTCVEREGTMTGIDLSQVRKLRETVN